MKKALIITISILVLIGGAVAWMLLKKKASTSAGIDNGSDTGSSGSSSSTELSKNESLMPLVRGSGYSNKEQEQLVKDLQTGLNQNHGANISVDGDFGGQTYTALLVRGLPTTIYWKEWSYITKKPIYVGGQKVTITSLTT